MERGRRVPIDASPTIRRPQRSQGFAALAALSLLLGAGHVQAGDREDVLARINEYMAHEQSGDLIAQGRLMLDERSMVYPGGRMHGNNREGMQRQQADQDAFAAAFPGVRYEFELRDIDTQVWNGDSALVTFDSVPTRIVPASLPPEAVAKLGPPKIPLIVAAMLVKQEGVWKIAHTTFVPRDKE
ncbi:hypothetical protein [Pseudoxanthomonas sp. PXM02]|uniref:hypothetical protein n=1 Tax=Pseudoxanthomonas sp. PXM02 TaxID=2769294 RepID=UPI0017858B06|nr:hypothetical protein [Pseudoxanthomonas sp. PXM02]MBD9480162.1 hypothetical protein [Pseudoxanthomonas sp. PXM02]